MKKLLIEDRGAPLKAYLLLDLLVIAGSTKRLAQLLGVTTASVYSWIHHGQISPQGATLVERSKELKAYFTAEHLRPDVELVAFSEARCTKYYHNACRRQRAYEKTEDFKTMSPTRAINRHKPKTAKKVRR